MTMYLLDLNKLETGDIILTRSDSEISQRVRKITGSQYSHAILYVGASSCIESDGPGVQSQNIQRMLFENPNNVKVLRLKSKDHLDKIQNVIVFARQKIGTEYSSMNEVITAVRKTEPKAKEPNRQFCTRFVAQSYENAGLRIVENPDYCTPEEILKSDALVEVIDVLRKAHPAEIEFANSESPLEKQKKIHNSIFEYARKLSGKDIQTFEQLSKYVLENRDKEPAITQFIRDSGYLTMWEMDTENNPWHYDAEKLMEHYKDPQQAVELALFFATTEKDTRDRFILTLEAMHFGYSFFGQKYFADQIELCEKLIELSLQRELTALKILKS